MCVERKVHFRIVSLSGSKCDVVLFVYFFCSHAVIIKVVICTLPLIVSGYTTKRSVQANYSLTVLPFI